MTESTPETTGRFETRKSTRPATEVDCSGWADTSAGWTTGSFSARKATAPAIEVDCSNWSASVGWLEVVVSFDDKAAPAKVFERTLLLIRALHEEYRREGIALSYDVARSRAEGERVIVALRMGSALSEELRNRAVVIAERELAKVP